MTVIAINQYSTGFAWYQGRITLSVPTYVATIDNRGISRTFLVYGYMYCTGHHVNMYQ